MPDPTIPDGSTHWFWAPCSGCYEVGDNGAGSERYQRHPEHEIMVGAGCDECDSEGIRKIPCEVAPDEDPLRPVGAAVEALLNQGYTSQEVIAAFGPDLTSDAARWVQGFAGYHDGIEHGIGGEAWTRMDAMFWCRGWEAAAKRDGNRPVTRADCGEDFDSCDCCSAMIKTWHSPACVMFRDAT